MFTKQDQRLIFSYDAEKLWIEPWGDNALRVRATKMPEMPMEDWALLSSEESKAEISITPYGASIVNGKIKAELNTAGKITFYNQKGELLLEEYVRNRKEYKFEPDTKPTGFASALEIEAREFKPILGGDYSITMRFESNPEEKIFGMGQYQQPFLNLKGCELELAHRNSQASVPFMISSLGYGMLWNNPAIGRVTFGKNITTWQADSSKIIDYWICAGDTPAEIEETYAKATGTVPMMPDFAMGFWQCKLRYQTQEELLEVAREYKRRGLPISVIVIDFFHWTMQGEWKFDPDYWPDPDAMIKELKEMGIELMVSIWPTVDHRSENYDEMVENGYLIRTDRGHRIAMDFHGNTVHFDPTNPGAREYVWQKIKKNYYDRGIRIFWLDEAEPEYTYYHFDLYRYHLGPNVQIGNIYPVMYAKTFFDGMKEAGQENIINLIRCAWAGSQRYGALLWSGDIHSSFRSMRDQLVAGLNVGLAGIPWWTTDIGGFHGGNPDDPEFREVFVRWFQYGTFCPVMRLHGDREPHSEPLGTKGGGVCSSGAANEVWSYGPEVYEICKKYMEIRERIKPYVKELMKEAHEKGTPVIRPLFYDFPQDKTAWEVDDQYMFGPDVLVAPVLYAKMESRKVYLPEGTEWKNAWTGQEFQGGQTIEVDTPIDIIPLFVRKGVELPIY
ncbi:MAG: glycoside hydrolase family 31 protein [Caldicoprobacterales bacterium]|jgi:alpha-D-xyloside xylohydrolase|nr:glycoside hydrolase family 31 protein [Clostridiales bacterium]